MKYMIFYFGYIFLLSDCHVCGKRTLEHKLRTWEVLTGDDIAIGRGRRSTNGKHYTYDKEVSFTAFKRQFTLSLLASPEIFTPDFKAYVHGEKGPRVIKLDKMSMYEGTVLGEPKSVVHAHMQDKQVIANIKTEDDVYVIEPSWRHLPEHEGLNDNKARMIIYRQSDVNMTVLNHHKNSSLCAVDDLMKEIRQQEKMNANFSQSNPRSVVSHHRSKRDVGNKKICTIDLVADHRFFQFMGNGNTLETMYYLITLIKRVNRIFKETDWGEEEEVKGQYVGYGFQISSIIVHSEPTNDPSYNSMGDAWSAQPLLKEFSEVKRTECLAHLFTYLDFAKGVLGLAYVGNSRDVAAGGICSSKYQGIGQNSLYFNTGLTTTKNWGSRILTLEADLVTTHELGHNFGAEHDNGEVEDCSPGESNGGNFIMYPAAVNGLYKNNEKFSKCSKHNVLPVIKKRSPECFVEDKKAYCGNFKIEEGEQCDAGYLQEDECCDKDCKLRPGKICSPKNSLCCIDCQIASNKTICYSEIKGTCYTNTYCDGKNVGCPDHVPKDNGTACGDSGECLKGQCQPFCVKEGLKPCLCTRRKEDMCKRCCAPVNATGPNLIDLCVPFKSERLRDNARCSLGYCNKTECIKQTQDVIERVWSIFENIAPDKIGEFLADNIVGAVLVFSLLIWIPFGCLVNFVDKRREEHRRKEEEWFAERMSDPYRMNPDGGNFGSVTALHHVTQKSAAAKAGLNSKMQWNAAKDKGSVIRKSQEGLDEIADDDKPTTSAALNMEKRDRFPVEGYVDVHTAQDSFLSDAYDTRPPKPAPRRISRPQLTRQDHTTVLGTP